MGIPLVHGAIAGWYGHIATVLPGDATLRDLYACHGGEKGIEQQLGTPSFTPAVVASLQAAEACKLLLGMGTTYKRANADDRPDDDGNARNRLAKGGGARTVKGPHS